MGLPPEEAGAEKDTKTWASPAKAGPMTGASGDCARALPVIAVNSTATKPVDKHKHRRAFPATMPL